MVASPGTATRIAAELGAFLVAAGLGHRVSTR
jgi:hypothetical protein